MKSGRERRAMATRPIRRWAVELVSRRSRASDRSTETGCAASRDWSKLEVLENGDGKRRKSMAAGLEGAASAGSADVGRKNCRGSLKSRLRKRSKALETNRPFRSGPPA